MIKDKAGYFSKGKVIGSKIQRTVTIPLSDWKYMEVGSKITIYPIKEIKFKVPSPSKITGKECARYETGYPVTKTIKLIGNGRQRNVTIPKDDWDNYPIGTKVKMYPIVQPKSQSIKETAK